MCSSPRSDEKKVQLLVQGPPEPPYEVKTGDIKSRWAVITWSEAQNGNSPLLGYFVEYTLANCTCITFENLRGTSKSKLLESLAS